MIGRSLLAIALAALVAAPPAGAWTWPVDGPVLQLFSLGPNPYLGGQHRGIDIGAAAGEPVRAPAGGTVSFAGSVPSGGKTLTVQTAEGYSVTLVHLGSIEAVRGAHVVEGSAVGSAGPSGEPRSTDRTFISGCA